MHCSRLLRIFAARIEGEMPEWSNGAVSKTVELLVGSGGSNPPLSAKGNEDAAELALAAFLFPFAKPAAGVKGNATICKVCGVPDRMVTTGTVLYCNWPIISCL